MQSSLVLFVQSTFETIPPPPLPLPQPQKNKLKIITKTKHLFILKTCPPKSKIKYEFNNICYVSIFVFDQHQIKKTKIKKTKKIPHCTHKNQSTVKINSNKTKKK